MAPDAGAEQIGSSTELTSARTELSALVALVGMTSEMREQRKRDRFIACFAAPLSRQTVFCSFMRHLNQENLSSMPRSLAARKLHYVPAPYRTVRTDALRMVGKTKQEAGGILNVPVLCPINVAILERRVYMYTVHVAHVYTCTCTCMCVHIYT